MSINKNKQNVKRPLFRICGIIENAIWTGQGFVVAMRIDTDDVVRFILHSSPSNCDLLSYIHEKVRIVGLKKFTDKNMEMIVIEEYILSAMKPSIQTARQGLRLVCSQKNSSVNPCHSVVGDGKAIETVGTAELPVISAE